MGQINRDERGCLHLKQPVEKVRVALPHPQRHIIPCFLVKKLLWLCYLRKYTVSLWPYVEGEGNKPKVTQQLGQ